MQTTVSKLSKEARDLCRMSQEARNTSYSPYSKFRVGAAIQCVKDEDGKAEVITGCNVENASYGLAICAERTACVKAVSQGLKDFTSIAIAADLSSTFVGPCGACRQFLCEFNPSITIYLVRPDDAVEVTSLAQLLPECFSPKTMTLAFHNGTNKVHNKENLEN